MVLSLLACGRGNSSKKNTTALPGLPETVRLGETTATEIDKELGEPTNSYEIKDAVVQTYEDGKAIKIEDNVAKSYFRDPEGNEVYIQFWLQKWKTQTTMSEKIEVSKNVHGQMDYQLINKEEKTTVIYDSENGRVKRVMHYEK